MVDLRFFHASLAISIVKELKRRHKWPLRMGHDIAKGPALAVGQKLVTRDRNQHCLAAGVEEIVQMQVLHLQ